MCVGVRCGKTCCFVSNFTTGGTFHQMGGAKLDDFHAHFGPSLIHTTAPGKDKIWVRQTWVEKGGPK